MEYGMEAMTAEEGKKIIKDIVTEARKMSVTIIKRTSFDNPPKTYYVIEETVTPQGHTIEWQGIYATEEAAQKEIDRLKS